MSFKLITVLLKEFDYEKNGKEETIKFLIQMLDNLVNGKEVN